MDEPYRGARVTGSTFARLLLKLSRVGEREARAGGRESRVDRVMEADEEGGGVELEGGGGGVDCDSLIELRIESIRSSSAEARLNSIS